MSCRPGSGCCDSCGSHGLAGVGEIYGNPYPLNQTQIDAVLQRNPSIAARVLEWNILISTLDWSQVHEAGGLFSFTFQIPGAIPSEGIRFDDSVLGTIIIFPDAQGTLHFTGGYTGAAGQVANPFLPGLPNVNALLTFGFIVMGFLIYREARR